MSMTEATVDRIAQLGRQAQAHVIEHEGKTFIVHDDRQQVKDVTDPRSYVSPLPDRIKAKVSIDTKASLIEFVREQGQPHTRFFCAVDAGTIKAVIDWHDLATASADARIQACDYTATLQLRESEEWKRWAKIDQKLMPQAEFVRFLEENAADVETPHGADLLEIVRDFSAARKVNFSSAVRLDNGDISFEYAAETNARSKSGDVAVPRLFMLRLPVFYGEPPVSLGAFLRWSIDDGALKLGVELHRPAYVRQAVVEQVAIEVREATGLALFFGSLA